MSEATRFDPATADNPFERRVPELPAEATDRERQLAERYTQVSYILVPDDDQEDGCVPDATIVWLSVGNQSFRVSPDYHDTREQAAWLCWMLAKTLARVVEAETASA